MFDTDNEVLHKKISIYPCVCSAQFTTEFVMSALNEIKKEWLTPEKLISKKQLGVIFSVLRVRGFIL